MVARIRRKSPDGHFTDSAELFQFCRLMYSASKEAGNIPDIEIGREVLGYDHKYTHQFRHGFLQVDSLRQIAKIAAYFSIPIEIPLAILRREKSAQDAAEWALNDSNRDPKPISVRKKHVNISGSIVGKMDEDQLQVLTEDLRKCVERAEIILSSETETDKYFAMYAENSPRDKQLLAQLERPILTQLARNKQDQ